MTNKTYTLHYEMGQQAACRGDNIDTQPRFRSPTRIAAWLKGYADAQHDKQQREDAKNADKEGIKRLKSIIMQATEEPKA